MTFPTILTLAVLIEAIVEAVKPVWDKEKKWSIPALLALVISTAVCMLSGADLFKLTGSPLAVPFAGSFFTGIIVSRGANFLHDLWPTVTGLLNLKTAPLSPILSSAEIRTAPPEEKS